MDLKKESITFDDFYKIDLRVAKIVWAGLINGTQRLLKITLDVGELGQRIVVSPIGEHYTPQSLLNKRVVYLANLTPKKVRGILSCGAILTACPFDSKEKKYAHVLVSPDKLVKVGSILK